MFNTPAMVDMAMTPEEAQKESPVAIGSTNYDVPKYPWGLSIRLGEEELDKLEADFDGMEVGETYHGFVMFKITSKSSNETESGKPRRCVEMQITHMGVESEDEENEKAVSPRKKMYKK